MIEQEIRDEFRRTKKDSFQIYLEKKIIELYKELEDLARKSQRDFVSQDEDLNARIRNSFLNTRRIELLKKELETYQDVCKAYETLKFVDKEDEPKIIVVEKFQ